MNLDYTTFHNEPISFFVNEYWSTLDERFLSGIAYQYVK